MATSDPPVAKMAGSSNPTSTAPEKSTSKANIESMQERTRRERSFHETESMLPDSKSLAMLTVRPSGLFSMIRGWTKFQTTVSSLDTVWLFDNTAYRDEKTGDWNAEFVAGVFAQDPNCNVVEVVTEIAKLVKFADDMKAVVNIERRIIPFLLETLPGRRVEVLHGFRDKNCHRPLLTLGPTGANGLSSTVVTIPGHHHGGERVPEAASVPRGADGLLEARTIFAEPEGWGVISDIDDTIKVTSTSDPIGILLNTFVEQPEAVTGMPELYARLRAMLPRDSPFFYLSASPYNLYPFLRDFRDEFYPPGTLILRDSSWKTITGLLTNLTVNTEEYKVDRMKKINSWLPKRKMICIGDSTQSDPEAYGEIYRSFPGWVQMILIRRVTDIAAVGLKEKNEPERFEKAFEDIPKENWYVFEEPEECNEIFHRLFK